MPTIYNPDGGHPEDIFMLQRFIKPQANCNKNCTEYWWDNLSFALEIWKSNHEYQNAIFYTF